MRRMRCSGSEGVTLRSDGDGRAQVRPAIGGKRAKIACRRMQRQEERTAEDAIPAMDSAKGEECNDTLHGRCTALLTKERCSEEAKMVAARDG
jgi:hypothetical protein